MVHVNNLLSDNYSEGFIAYGDYPERENWKGQIRLAVGIKMEWKEEWEGYSGKTEDNSYAVWILPTSWFMVLVPSDTIPIL